MTGAIGRRGIGVARVAAVGALVAQAGTAAAQARPQLRGDLLAGERVAAHAGAGVEVDAGLYVRLALVGAAGMVAHDGGAGASGRIEGIARFLLDPLRQSRHGAYAGGGIGVRRDANDDARGYLLAVVGVEGHGPRGGRGGWVPAVEVGVGGGARLSVVLRRARPNAR